MLARFRRLERPRRSGPVRARYFGSETHHEGWASPLSPARGETPQSDVVIEILDLLHFVQLACRCWASQFVSNGDAAALRSFAQAAARCSSTV